ncbi:hypothetical protein [Roseovarius sp. EL26]|uniref:hypothetical protein n=1 Tax=Roseovarius sp. EL26 TaxID=2126672 RepID=UPI000EA19FD3|nr:hypothetical protein [Roseovarius sp. EL26]
MATTKVLVPVRKPSGDFCIYEIEQDHLNWPEMREIWAKASIERPFCFAPPEEKLDVFFSYACKAAAMPISLGTVFNPSWSQLFIKTIKHDCLVISASLSSYLIQSPLFEQILPDFKQLAIIGTASDHALETLSARHAHLDIHILPNPVEELSK